ncbi:MAG TPA: HlyD family efflux transporter periplasmic adaptor subunit [Roseiflexaceae bacterium]|nr:HlyD family efflux transporter periplasmic adaptor subunit [Roseiflexaceae bacterium]
MNRTPALRSIILILLFPLLAACGASSAAQPEPPTPTPLPPDPALERPTYTVKRDSIDQVLTVNGRVTPVDLTRLSFKRDGRVNTVAFARGDTVKQGELLAELQQADQLDDLREAQDGLVQAQRDLENAKKEQAKKIEQAQLALDNAKEDLARVLPGGEDDPIRKAQQELADAQREGKDAGDSGSEAKTEAEHNVLKAAEALQDAQKAREKAFWNNDWAQKYGTDPANPSSIDPTTGKKIPNKLTKDQKQAFADALIQANRALREAERGVDQANRAADKAHEDEIVKNDQATQKVVEAQRKLDSMISGKGNKDVIEAQRKVKDAELALEEAQSGSYNTQQKAVEDAQRRLDKAQKKVEDGRIVAPQNGQLLAISISEGDNVTAFDPVVEIADPSQLEVASELSAEQMKRLAEGQPVEINTLSRPDVVMPAIIRQLPSPYGSGGSGAVQEQDRTTRFKILDLKGQEVEAGVTIVKIRIVLEHKDNVLWLPPDAVRSFEGRRFVVVRNGDRERRVTVKTGIETEDKIEIVEGLKEGDVIVGQ